MREKSATPSRRRLSRIFHISFTICTQNRQPPVIFAVYTKDINQTGGIQMIKKRLIATLATGAILASAALVSASPAETGAGAGPGPRMERPCMMDSVNWTAEQRAQFQQDMQKHHEKMMELQKEFIKEEVAKGLISQDWADQHLKRMQERMDWQKAHPGEHPGAHHRGMTPDGPRKAPSEQGF